MKKRMINKLFASIMMGVMLFNSAAPYYVKAEGEDAIVSEETVSEDNPADEGEQEEVPEESISDNSVSEDNASEDETVSEDVASGDGDTTAPEDEESGIVSAEYSDADEGLESSGEMTIEEQEESDGFLCADHHETSPVLIQRLKALDASINGDEYSISMAPGMPSVFGTTDGICPSIGEIHPFIAMVDFSDVKFGAEFTKQYVYDVFFGEENVNSPYYPIESLSAWYKRSSYGKLIFSGEEKDIIEIHLDKTREYYTDTEENGGGRDFEKNLAVYDTIKTSISDMSRYDSDSDGHIDALCIIFAGNAGNWASQWWSSVYEIPNGEDDRQLFAHIIEEHIQPNSSGTMTTAIHEFGHLLGLPDLYSTAPGSDQIADGIHTADMMCNNGGDFNAFCKILLGWIDENNIRIVNKSDSTQIVNLKGFSSTGQFAIVNIEDGASSIFGEYFLIQYEDLTENSNILPKEYNDNTFLRIYHVNSELNEEGNNFKYSNYYQGDCRLIWLVDKDSYVMHGGDQGFSGDYIYNGYKVWLDKEFNCGYFTGDELTPYTTPSSMKYPKSRKMSDGGEFSGLSVQNITINNDIKESTFSVSYDNTLKPISDFEINTASAYYQNDSGDYSTTDLNVPKFYLRANHEFFINDDNIDAYIRKTDGTVVGNLNVNVSTPFIIVHWLREYQNYYTLLAIYEGALDIDSDYELVFPAGMFKTVSGVVNKDIIVNGIYTDKPELTDNKVTFEKENYGIYTSSYDNDLNGLVEYAVMDGYNITIPVNKSGVGIVACTINGKTGELIDEKLLLADDVEINNQWDQYNYDYFGRMENGKYLLITHKNSLDFQPGWIMIFDNNLDLEMKSEWSTHNTILTNHAKVRTQGNIAGITEAVIDTDSLAVTRFDREKDYCNQDYWDEVFPIGDYYLCQLTGRLMGYVEYRDTNTIAILDKNFNIVNSLEGLKGFVAQYIEENAEGYVVLGYENRNIVKYCLDKDFEVTNRCVLKEKAGILKVFRLNTGYIITWCTDKEQYRSGVFDLNFHLLYETKLFSGAVTNINGREYLCSLNSSGALYFDSGEKLIIGFSDAIKYSCSDHIYGDEERVIAVSDGYNSSDGGIIQKCKLCGDEQIIELVPYAKDLSVEKLIKVNGSYSADIILKDSRGIIIPKDLYSIDYSESTDGETVIVSAILSGIRSGRVEKAVPFEKTIIALNTHSENMQIGETKKLNAEVVLGTVKDDITLCWTSDNEEVAEVDDQGNVVAKKAGGATIKVTAEGDDTIFDSCYVNVYVIEVTGVSVSPNCIEIMVGETKALCAIVNPSNATNNSVSWISLDPDIVTVSEDGMITAVSVGIGHIVVRTYDGDHTDTCEVTVKQAIVPVTCISVSPNSIELTVGDTKDLTATVTPEDATNKNVTWSSSNIAIATVSDNGVVTAVGAGEAAITVKTEDGGFTDTCIVKVNPIVVAVTGVSVSPNSVELTVGETKDLTVTVTPADATNKNITWSSSDTTIVTVSDNGVITAVAAGEATITVKTEDGGFEATCAVKVNPIIVAVTGVSVSPNSVELTVGETKNLRAIVTPEDATTKSVMWSSSNEDVVTVTSYGLLTAIADGEATITVKTEDGGFTDTCTVKVNPVVVAVTGVSVSPNSVELTVGETKDLTATVSPADATNKNVTWSSSAEDVVIVSDNGVITAVSAGEATITVKTEDGGYTETCVVKVNPVVVAVTGVSVSPNSVELTVGDTKDLTATISPVDATNKNVTWSSSDETVATVSDIGVITAVSAGEAAITVKTEDGGFTDTCIVKVNPIVVAVTGVSVSLNSVELTVGETKDLTVTVTPSDATNKNVTWSSSDETVATVSDNGVITAVSAGEATITVKTEDGGFMDICTVKVNPVVVAVTGVSVSPNSVELTVGETKDLTAAVSPADATNKSITWSSSDASIVTVSDNGVITAIAAGEATITVTTNDGGFTATCMVKVDPVVVPVTGVSVSPNEVTLIIGDTKELAAAITPLDATDKSVSWSSSDTAVATVDEKGIVTAVAAGKATITVKTNDGGFTASCEVTVKKKAVPVSGVRINEGSAISLKPGEEKLLSATVSPMDADDKNVTWSSSDESVVTVSANGLIKAVADSGFAIITVTTADGSKTAECRVDIIKKEDYIYAEFVDGNEYVYTGSAITPAVRVFNGDEELIYGVDYTVSYKNNKNVNTDPRKAPTVTITGKTFAGSMTQTFDILKKDLSDADVTGCDAIRIKKNTKPVPELYYGSSKLASKDYDIVYDAKADNGKYSEDGILTVKGKGNFEGEREIEIIVATPVKIKVTKFKAAARTYNGKEQLLDHSEYELVVNKKVLAEGDDYTVEYLTDTVNAGTVKVAFIGIGDYTGTVTKTYKINPDKAVTPAVNVDAAAAYTPTGAYPAVTVVLNNTELDLGKDYKLSYSGNKKITDKAKVTVTFLGNYKGAKAISKTFSVTAPDIMAAGGTAYCADMVYTKAGKYFAAPYVNVNGVVIAKGDYNVTYRINGNDISKAKIDDSYFANSNAVTVDVKITFDKKVPKFTGELNTTYNIVKPAAYDKTKDLSKAKISITDSETGKKTTNLLYTGQPVELGGRYKLTVTFGSGKNAVTLTEGTDFEIIKGSYSNNVNKGKATVVINAKDGSGYFGSKVISFNITNNKGLSWF